VRVFYLATAPVLFGPTCQRLGEADLVTPDTRVVLKKPIGHDLASSKAINNAVGAVFGEDQIYSGATTLVIINREPTGLETFADLVCVLNEPACARGE
jgi:hypothetical protein